MYAHTRAAGLYIGVQNYKTLSNTRKTIQLKEHLLGASTRNMDVAPSANLQPPRRLRHLQRHQGHRRRGYNQGTLIAWLDEQERLLRMRGTPDVVVQEFDPLHNLPEPRSCSVLQRMWKGLSQTRSRPRSWSMLKLALCSSSALLLSCERSRTTL